MRLLLLFSLFNLCLGHYKWKDTSLFFGWYGYNPDVMEGWTNLGYSLNLTLLVNNANKGINQLYVICDNGCFYVVDFMNECKVIFSTKFLQELRAELEI